jgi:hypothetical protein
MSLEDDSEARIVGEGKIFFICREMHGYICQRVSEM